jgi:hypothetical protein
MYDVPSKHNNIFYIKVYTSMYKYTHVYAYSHTLFQGYKSKFDSLGLNVPPEEIFSSSFAAAAYLEQVYTYAYAYIRKHTCMHTYVHTHEEIFSSSFAAAAYLEQVDTGMHTCDICMCVYIYVYIISHNHVCSPQMLM